MPPAAALSATPPLLRVLAGQYGFYNGGAGGGLGFGVMADGVYATGGDIDLTTAWGVNAAYEHFWTKRWQTSVYGDYTATSYDSTANAPAVR